MTENVLDIVYCVPYSWTTTTIIGFDCGDLWS
jgi:hypothetical protein